MFQILLGVGVAAVAAYKFLPELFKHTPPPTTPPQPTLPQLLAAVPSPASAVQSNVAASQQDVAGPGNVPIPAGTLDPSSALAGSNAPIQSVAAQQDPAVAPNVVVGPAQDNFLDPGSGLRDGQAGISVVTTSGN